MRIKLGSAFIYRDAKIIIDVLIKIKNDKYKILEVDRRTTIRGTLHCFDADKTGIAFSRMYGPDGNENIIRSTNVE